MKIITSLIFCTIAFIIFLAVATASRSKLPTGLRDLYGDTSGIRQLNIQGEVISWEGRYGYSFNISPNGDTTRVRVFRNTQSVNNFLWWPFPSLWWMFTFGVSYLPVEPSEPVVSDSEHGWFIDSVGNRANILEYRFYGEVFVVEPNWHSHRLYLPSNKLAADARLYIDIGQGGFIFSHHNDINFTQFRSDTFLQSASSIRLPNQLRIDNIDLFVPSGPGLFGQTAVYTVYAPGWGYPVVHGLPDGNSKVVARELFPISLERGKDEILGLIELENDFLLLILRANGHEIIRIHPLTGESQTVFVESEMRLRDSFLQEDSLVLRGFSDIVNTHAEIAVIDLREGGLKLAGHFPVMLIAEESVLENESPSVDIRDILLKEGVVYIAYMVTRFPGGGVFNTDETFISAFDIQGRLIGRSQVLNGVEDDAFWRWGSTSGGLRYQRRVQKLSIGQGR